MATTARKPAPARMTVSDFLDWAGHERQSYQLVDGQPRAMSPGSATHATIQAVVAHLLIRHLDEVGSPCRVATEPAVSPRVRADANLRVPDVAVTCTPDEPGQRILPDPVLLVEVLSPSNESDTWENVWAYTTIPSVREILIIHSTRAAAELLRRGADGSWPEQSEHIGAAGTLGLKSLGFSCPLSAVYARTHLARD